ncbi:hypothetical protein SB761_32755, partial [Pseudomonas sp. SIMBA_064]
PVSSRFFGVPPDCGIAGANIFQILYRRCPFPEAGARGAFCVRTYAGPPCPGTGFRMSPGHFRLDTMAANMKSSALGDPAAPRAE